MPQVIQVNCRHHASTAAIEQSKKSFRLSHLLWLECQRKFNECAGTRFNQLQSLTDAGIHEAVRDWEERFAPLVTGQLRSRRTCKAGCSWYVDGTYVKVNYKWRYRQHYPVESTLSKRQDMAAKGCK
jgi:hypothetical protein